MKATPTPCPVGILDKITCTDEPAAGVLLIDKFSYTGHTVIAVLST